MKNQGIINEFQRGNALIIILIIIALLGALTVTVTRMGEQENDVSQEEASILASQVLRQAKTITNAVEGLLAKGCSINQLSFENSVEGGYENLHSPPDKSCWVFDVAGAGLSFPVAPSAANNGSKWIIARHNNIAGVGPERETGVQCSARCEDLLLVLPLVSLNVCKALNAQVNLSPFSSAPPQNQGAGGIDLYVKFYASMTSPTDNNYSNQATSNTGFPIKTSVTPINSNALWDKKTACIEAASGYRDPDGNDQPGSGKYFFYQVLVER